MLKFFKVLQFVLSDEFLELQELLLKNYRSYSIKTILSQLEQIQEEQKKAENNLHCTYQEIKEAETDIHKIYELCKYLKNKNDIADNQVGAALNKEDIVQLIVKGIACERNEWKEELGAVKQLLAEKHGLDTGQQAQLVEQSAQFIQLQKQFEERKRELAFCQSRIRVLEKENEDLKSQFQNVKPRAKEDIRINPYRIITNREKYLFHADDLENVMARLGNTMIMEKFFEDVPQNNPYKKMYERYKKKLRKCIEEMDDDDELEDCLSVVVSVVQGDLLKKMMIAIYRGKKRGSSVFEDKLLPAVNAYLEFVGFYIRDNIHIGDVLKDEDFEDMEFIKDERSTGRKHGEITEIELYPYYINYFDEDGKKRKIHTQGMMIVSV